MAIVTTERKDIDMDHDKDPEHEPTRPEPPAGRTQQEEEKGYRYPPVPAEKPFNQGGRGGLPEIDPPDANTTLSDI